MSFFVKSSLDACSKAFWRFTIQPRPANNKTAKTANRMPIPDMFLVVSEQSAAAAEVESSADAPPPVVTSDTDLQVARYSFEPGTLTFDHWHPFA